MIIKQETYPLSIFLEAIDEKENWDNKQDALKEYWSTKFGYTLFQVNNVNYIRIDLKTGEEASGHTYAPMPNTTPPTETESWVWINSNNNDLVELTPDEEGDWMAHLESKGVTTDAIVHAFYLFAQGNNTFSELAKKFKEAKNTFPSSGVEKINPLYIKKSTVSVPV